MSKAENRCLGKWHYSMDGNEFDCDHEFAVNCEDCKFGSCGGKIDPRFDADHQPKRRGGNPCKVPKQKRKNHDMEGGLE